MDELNGKVVEGTDSNIKNIEEPVRWARNEMVIGEQKLDVETDLSPTEAMLKTLDNESKS